MDMMQIKARYRSQLAQLAGTTAEQVEAAAVKDVLRHIKERYGDEAVKTAKTMLITVNGESILHLGHFKTPLREGDEVSFLPVCGGG